MLQDMMQNMLTYPAWKKIGIQKLHGINTPLFSLRTEASEGIGEFMDLMPLIDWVQGVGFHILQILPINDTGYSASPYNALSSIALNPIFLRLSLLEDIQSIPIFSETIYSLKKLNQKPKVDYREVRLTKMRCLEKYVAHIEKDPSWKKRLFDFIDQQPWVKTYALFMALKKKNGQSSWLYWPEEEKNPTSFTDLFAIHEKECLFYAFIQLFCYSQCIEIKRYAEKKGVYLKGDIPILLSPDSADVWAERENFSLEYTTGCPPDLFNYEGQNWGFPLFSWNYLKKNNYLWWRRRLQFAEQFFHLYRIDHLVGFFRIWAIPLGSPPT